jgi:glycogen debranching enzyme
MPCPAEYNFFFTHDVLMTNLGAVNCDLQRVKRDLVYISSHSKDDIIPHAYYWKDDGFKTEFCTPDNWNHLWFIIVTASYLRHSMDDSTCAAIYPLVTRSLEEVLQQRKDDDLMYAFRPDWWDIGRNEGPRAYITILTIRALREYVYMSAALGKTSRKLVGYEHLADAMQHALQERLWDDQARYLMNFNGNVKDHHYYMGSLLAASFNLLSPLNGRQLVESASRELVEPRIGVRNVYPVDFHTDSVRSFFKFVGNEAGDPYVYANGGVWPHNNAWYTLALQATGRVDEALSFFKTTMTMDGVVRSPMGQPAMFEYRFSDPSSPEFGRIDKPSFLWAGGFYLYTLYNLLGVQDKEWNISLSGPVPGSFDSVRFDLAFGHDKRVNLQGKGNALQSFIADGVDVPSRVLPLSLAGSVHWNVTLGKLKEPILEQVNAILYSARFNHAERKLELELSSFDGHVVFMKVDAPWEAKSVLLDGKPVSDVAVERQVDGAVALLIHFHGLSDKQRLEISF